MSNVSNVNTVPVQGSVPVAQTTSTTVTTQTSAVPVAVVAPVAQVQTINREPIIKTVQDAPIVQNIIEKQNVEVRTREVIREIHEQPIIEIEKRPEVRTIQQDVVYERQELPVREEIVGTRAALAEIPLTRQTEVGPRGETIMGGVIELEPVIERIIERPVYKHIIIERHEIPVQVVYTYVPVYHPGQPVPHLNETGIQNLNIAETSVVQAPLVNQHAVRVVGPIVAPQAAVAPQAVVAPQPVTQPLVASTAQTAVLPGQNVNVTTTTQTVPVNIRQIRTGVAKDTWGLSDAGSLYSLKGNQWDRVNYAPLGQSKIRDFSAVKDGFLWYIDDNGSLYKYNPKSQNAPISVFTSQEQYGRFDRVNAYGQEGAYILTDRGTVVNVDGQDVRTIPAAGIRSLAVGNPKKSLFGRNNFEMWGTDEAGFAHRYENDTWVNKGERMRDITIGRDNTVFGIDESGRLRKWDSRNARFLTGAHRQNQQFGEFQSLSAYNGSKNIHGIASNGGIYDLSNDIVYN